MVSRSLIPVLAGSFAALAPTVSAFASCPATLFATAAARRASATSFRPIRMMASSAQSQTFTIDAAPAPGQPFHLAFPVRDIEESRKFYGEILGCTQGRIAPGKWVDYSLSGHQIVCHWAGNDYKCVDYYNPVDGDDGSCI